MTRLERTICFLRLISRQNALLRDAKTRDALMHSIRRHQGSPWLDFMASCRTAIQKSTSSAPLSTWQDGWIKKPQEKQSSLDKISSSTSVISDTTALPSTSTDGSTT